MKAFRRSLISISLVVLAVVVLANPHLAGAQSDAAETDLHASIRAALMEDPQTAQMSEAQLDSMVAALASQAAKQGVTSEDIRWAPGQVSESAANECGSMPRVFCMLNNAFGFDGSDMKIPIGLGITSGLLIILLGIALERHHAHVKAARLAAAASSGASVAQTSSASGSAPVPPVTPRIYQ